MQWAGALFPWPYLSSANVLRSRWKHLNLTGICGGTRPVEKQEEGRGGRLGRGSEAHQEAQQTRA